MRAAVPGKVDHDAGRASTRPSARQKGGVHVRCQDHRDQLRVTEKF